MASLKIFWTLTALVQRDYVFEYWNIRNKNTSYSQRLNSRIKERINHLRTNPFLGKLTEFENTRVLSLGHYNIFYRNDEGKVIITGFWDNRQNPKKLLQVLRGKD